MEVGLYKSIVLVRALVAAVVRRGVEQDALFQGSKFERGLLGDSSARISLQDWHALVKRALALTGDPGLALTIGSEISDHMLQIVGQLALSGNTLREAIGTFERYRILLSNATRYELIEDGELNHFVCAPLLVDPDAPHFDPEMVLSLVYRVGRRFATLDSHDAQEVWFKHPAPAHAARYAAVFRCPVHFDRPRNAILVERRYLDERQRYANARLHRVLQEEAERMLEELEAPSLPDRVRILLRSQVDLSRIDSRRMAALLKLHPRTLRRQLIRANAPWSSLLDETRCRIACEELRRSDVSIPMLAHRLGFSEPSAFNRAFKRWTGKTPAQYNRAMLSLSGQDPRRAGDLPLT
jgi:AraC-like DNA-binding protein